MMILNEKTKRMVLLSFSLEIGGASDQQNEIIKEILSQRTGRGQSTTSMSLMVQRP